MKKTYDQSGRLLSNDEVKELKTKLKKVIKRKINIVDYENPKHKALYGNKE